MRQKGTTPPHTHTHKTEIPWLWTETLCRDKRMSAYSLLTWLINSQKSSTSVKKKACQWELDPVFFSLLLLIDWIWIMINWVWDLSQQHFCLFSSIGPWRFLAITRQSCAKSSDMRNFWGFFSRKKFQLLITSKSLWTCITYSAWRNLYSVVWRSCSSQARMFTFPR